MKSFITIVMFGLLTFDVLANVECVKDGRYWRPSNQVAKDIASALKVKTCNGKRFKETVKKLGMTSNVSLEKKMSVADVLAKYGKKSK